MQRKDRCISPVPPNSLPSPDRRAISSLIARSSKLKLILHELGLFPIDHTAAPHYSPSLMSPDNLDHLRFLYKRAVDEWVDAIRAEEDLATPDHSMLAWEKWDAAHFAEHDAHERVTVARDAYKDALRAANYGI